MRPDQLVTGVRRQPGGCPIAASLCAPPPSQPSRERAPAWSPRGQGFGRSLGLCLAPGLGWAGSLKAFLLRRSVCWELSVAAAF